MQMGSSKASSNLGVLQPVAPSGLTVTRRRWAFDSLRTFSGQLITGGGSFSDVTAVKLETGDAYAVSQNQRTISFLFLNYGHIDGLNFHTHCVPSIAFAFQSDGVVVPPAKITIGHAGVHPKTDPFTLARVVTSASTTTTTKGS